MNQPGFENRNAIVTDGAQGIGLANAQRLLAAKTAIFDQMNPQHIN